MKPLYKEILFSSFLFISAFLLTIFIHESGHAFLVKYFSIPGTFFHNRIDWNYEVATTEQSIWVCLGGSIFSFIQLLIFLPVAVGLKTDNRFVRLFICWLALFATVTFLGYWVIGLIPTWSDISGFYELTGTHWWIRIVVAVGVLFLFPVVLGRLKYPISYSMNLKLSEDPVKQAKFVILYPSFIATGILILLTFPVKSLISISFPASIPLFVLSTYFRIAKDKSLIFKDNELTNNQWIASILLFVMLTIISILFSRGISLQ